MRGWLRKLRAILALRPYGRLAVALAGLYLLLFLIALRDLSLGGGAPEVLTVEWTRMFERTGPVTFEPIARLTLPWVTLLLSPLNLLIGLALAVLAGLNLAVTVVAFRHPAACRFNRSTGVLASVPALLAGGACCAPTVVLLAGIQASSLMIGVFQVLIPVSFLLLLLTLAVVVGRTDPELLPT
jgi:hypothetical protein